MNKAAEKQVMTIDGKEYSIADLNENSRSQIVNLRYTDQEIARLQTQLAITQTARATYAQALAAELKKKSKH